MGNEITLREHLSSEGKMPWTINDGDHDLDINEIYLCMDGTVMVNGTSSADGRNYNHPLNQLLNYNIGEIGVTA